MVTKIEETKNEPVSFQTSTKEESKTQEVAQQVFVDNRAKLPPKILKAAEKAAAKKGLRILSIT